VQALVQHDIESERDALGDVEPMKVVNLRRMFVSRRSNLVSVRYNSRRRVVSVYNLHAES